MATRGPRFTSMEAAEDGVNFSLVLLEYSSRDLTFGVGLDSCSFLLHLFSF